MKIFLAIPLMLLYSSSFCQNHINSTITSDLSIKIANIDKYIGKIDTAIKIFHMPGLYNPISEYSIYRKTTYRTYGAPYFTLKTIESTQNIKTSYFRDGKVVYISEISTADGNYSNIKNSYLENDSVIYTTNQLCEEHILQIKCTFNAPGWGRNNGSYTLIVTKNSIEYRGEKQVTANNSLSSWNTLIGLLSLSDFDSVKSTITRTEADGSDLYYTIITDKRTHCFVNGYINPKLINLSAFFKQLDNLIAKNEIK